MITNVEILKQETLLGRRFNIYGDFENPLFLAKDVAEWIEHSNSRAMLDSVDEEEKVVRIAYTLGGNQEQLFLTENGVYEVLMQSRKPMAKQFKKGVKQILQSIRKHGAYMTPATIEKAILSPDFLIQLATNLKEEQQKRIEAETKIEIDRPKVQFAESFKASSTTYLMRDLAKYINQNICPMGEARLYDWMVANKYLIRTRRWSNSKQKYDYSYMPTQSASDMKIFHVIPTHINTNSGEYLFTKNTVKLTSKGEAYFIGKFLEQNKEIV